MAENTLALQPGQRVRVQVWQDDWRLGVFVENCTAHQTVRNYPTKQTIYGCPEGNVTVDLDSGQRVHLPEYEVEAVNG